MSDETPSAFQRVNDAYNESMSAYENFPVSHQDTQKYAYVTAADAGGDSLKDYTQELADNSLQPLIENSNLNPVQASAAKEQIGLNESNADQIVGNRYSEYGQYQIGKLEKKFSAMKHLYEDVMFASEDQKGNVEAILQDYMEREYITSEEPELFSKVRSNLIEKREGAAVESIFLAINNNSNRIIYLKRELCSGRINSDLVKNLVAEYGLTLSDPDKKELGLSKQ